MGELGGGEGQGKGRGNIFTLNCEQVGKWVISSIHKLQIENITNHAGGGEKSRMGNMSCHLLNELQLAITRSYID